MKLAGLAILVCLAVTATAQSGAAGFFNPLSASHDGIHLYGVSVFTGYFSGGVPFEVSTVSILPASGPVVVTGVSANFGWTRSAERSSVAISYSPSYTAYPNHTDFNTISQTFSMNWNRKVGQKWSFNFGVTGLVSNLQQMYFSANGLGQAASLPTTFDGLAGAILSGTFTDSQLASALTGVSANALPEQAYVYGRRIGSASVVTGLSYAPSGRSSLHASVTANRMQGLNSGEATQGATQSLIPQTTAASVNLGWGYSLSSRTHIGVDMVTSRTFSRLQDGYASDASFSIGRTMSTNWFLQGTAGVGVLTYLRQTIPVKNNIQYTGGGSLGYKLRSHTLLASLNRSLGDSYGLGSASTDAATVGWAWKAPGSSWSLSANFGYQQLRGSAVRGYESWRATGGIARALNAHMFVSLQYAYFTLPSNLVLSSEMLGAQSGVTMNLSWSPSQYR